MKQALLALVKVASTKTRVVGVIAAKAYVDSAMVRQESQHGLVEVENGEADAPQLLYGPLAAVAGRQMDVEAAGIVGPYGAFGPDVGEHLCDVLAPGTTRV